MKELLIVRSISFQQLDLNLPEIKKRFPDYKISLLTHPHGVALASKYRDIDKVYSYDYSASFQKKNKVKELEGKTFEAVLVPVTNLSGSSFANVLHYGTSLKAKEYYMCNLVSDITRITPTGVLMRRILNGLFRVLSGILTIPAGLIYLVMWVCHAGSLTKREE